MRLSLTVFDRESGGLKRKCEFYNMDHNNWLKITYA